MRFNRGWKQSELAEMTGITQSHLSKYERGKVEPTITYLLKLSELMGKELHIEYGADISKHCQHVKKTK